MDMIRPFRAASFAIVLSFTLFSVARGQSASGNGALTVEEVVNLSKAGVAEDVIVTKIRMNGKPFDLNGAEIVELKKAGISDLVINVLMNPAYKPEPAPIPPPAPVHADPPPATSPPPPPKHYPPDDFAQKVPPEPGLYRFPKSSPERIAVRVLLGLQEGAGLGKVVLKKPKSIAYLVGPSAETRIKDPAPAFYLRLPEGKAIEDIVLVAMDRKNDRRELEMGQAGPKQPEVRRQFDYTEIGPNLFKLTVSKLGKGEYLFFQLGSAEPPKGISGRGFDFGIDEPHK